MTMDSESPFAAIPLGQEFKFEINRVTVAKGRTFSKEAMEELLGHVNLFIATQVAKRWEETGEPPTALSVHVRCDVG